MSIYFVVAAVAYVMGSVPFGYLLVRIFRGQDIRLTGSGNIGATNVARSGAKSLAIATLTLDALKGLLAVWFAQTVAHSAYNSCGPGGPCAGADRLMATAAMAAVLGHIFPVWLRFRGGKGVATALGVFVMIFPKALLISLLVFIAVVVFTRYVSLGSILASICFPIASWFVNGPDAVSLALVSVISAVIIFKHRQNIRRLIAGNENRLGRSTPRRQEGPA